MSGVVHIRGLGVLVDDRMGEPVAVRWVSISPAGEIEEHASSNRHAYSEELECRLQWALIRDVYAAIDPHGRCGDHLLAVGEIVHDEERGGMFLLPCRHADPGDENRVALAMLNGLLGEHPPVVYGTVAWIGHAIDDDGLHVSATDDQVAALRALALAVQEPAGGPRGGCM